MTYWKYVKSWAALAFILIAFLAYWQLYAVFKRPIPAIPREFITLDKSTSAQQFASLLAAKHWINNPRCFLMLIRLKGLSQSLKAGVYQINSDESALSLLRRVSVGDVLTLRFTIIAGTQQATIDKALQQAPYLTYMPDSWTVIKGGHLNAEGLLLADTYSYAGGSTSQALLEQAHKHLIQYLHSSWVNRTPNLPYTSPYALLTAASIIEKESASAVERRLIAGVLVNRINKGMPLQMDPTVIYGLQTNYKGHLSHKDMQVDSPYNSYRHRGLPPTPIAMVGKEALDAASHPAETNYLYFVAKGDGTHQFSETYLQQRQAIKHYLRKGH